MCACDDLTSAVRLSHRQVLEEPRSHDVGGHFGEDAPLLVVPPVPVGVVVVPRAGGGPSPVQPVACRDARTQRMSG